VSLLLVLKDSPVDVGIESDQVVLDDIALARQTAAATCDEVAAASVRFATGRTVPVSSSEMPTPPRRLIGTKILAT
jgi:hypothetical protein